MPPPGIAPGLPAPQAGVLLLYYSGGRRRLAPIRADPILPKVKKIKRRHATPEIPL